jgi:hypothetical protein
LIHYLPGKHCFFRAGNSVLLLFNPDDSKEKVSPPAHYGGGKQHFAFEVYSKDIRMQKKKLKERESS